MDMKRMKIFRSSNDIPALNGVENRLFDDGSIPTQAIHQEQLSAVRIINLLQNDLSRTLGLCFFQAKDFAISGRHLALVWLAELVGNIKSHDFRNRYFKIHIVGLRVII